MFFLFLFEKRNLNFNNVFSVWGGTGWCTQALRCLYGSQSNLGELVIVSLSGVGSGDATQSVVRLASRQPDLGSRLTHPQVLNLKTQLFGNRKEEKLYAK